MRRYQSDRDSYDRNQGGYSRRSNSSGYGRRDYNDYDDRYDNGRDYDDDDRYDVSNDYDEDYDSDYNDDRGYSRRGRGDEDRRGFASMDPEEVRRIASMGGRAAHERGTAHEWDSREAREAGHRGGLSRGRSYRDRDYDDDYDGGRRSRSSYQNDDYDDNDDRGGSYRSRGNYDYDDDYGRGASYNRGGNSGRSSRRGFAAMSPEQRSRIARMGGEASHGGGRRNNRGSSRNR